ncbi:hypothetical protein GQ600_4298 [Phytophthora cactorum]|nr:hypothetical protein GQ600_4298 [Phytophthora cactorum]
MDHLLVYPCCFIPWVATFSTTRTLPADPRDKLLHSRRRHWPEQRHLTYRAARRTGNARSRSLVPRRDPARRVRTDLAPARPAERVGALERHVNRKVEQDLVFAAGNIRDLRESVLSSLQLKHVGYLSKVAITVQTHMKHAPVNAVGDGIAAVHVRDARVLLVATVYNVILKQTPRISHDNLHVPSPLGLRR